MFLSDVPSWKVSLFGLEQLVAYGDNLSSGMVASRIVATAVLVILSFCSHSHGIDILLNLWVLTLAKLEQRLGKF